MKKLETYTPHRISQFFNLHVVRVVKVVSTQDQKPSTQYIVETRKNILHSWERKYFTDSELDAEGYANMVYDDL